MVLSNPIPVSVNPKLLQINQVGLTQVARSTGFFRKYVGDNEVFSPKKPDQPGFLDNMWVTRSIFAKKTRFLCVSPVRENVKQWAI
jgi:hypothetical protein